MAMDNEWQAILDAAWGGIGDIEDAAASALLDVSHAVASVGRPGTVAIIITVKPYKTPGGDMRRDRVVMTVKLKVAGPKDRDPGESADVYLDGGALTLTDPRQPGLAFADDAA